MVRHGREWPVDAVRLAEAVGVPVRVLLVGDQRIREILEPVLLRHGHEVVSVDGSAAARSAYEREPFDFVVIHELLFDGNGLDLCRRLRAACCGSTLIWCVTARRRPEELSPIFESGADDYLLEPLDRDWTEVRLHIAERRVARLLEQPPAGAAQDLATRKQLEEQLWQAQKFEAVGRLAGGVAHDFNNLLTAIMGYSDLLLLLMDSSDALRPHAEEIQQAAVRASALTRQLLAFSRRQVLQPKVINLNSVVTEIERMLRRLIGEDIELVAVLDPALGQVKADPGQIEQVIVNLAVNGRDAMPSGGKLTIETMNVELDETYARTHIAVVPGAYVMLAVSDTGHGIDPETRAHIFEPFFTTKDEGKGTGLGLPTVYGVVKQSGGNIWVYSEPNRGTTFKIYLPRVDRPVESAQRALGRDGLPTGTETVLLVEDEAAVRSLTGEFLRMSGYHVLDAKNGVEALATASGNPGPIHLLVTDVVMPQMGGRELARRLTALRPQIRVLYVSGYTEHAVIHHGVLEPRGAFLQKPFTRAELARKIRQVLDAP